MHNNKVLKIAGIGALYIVTLALFTRVFTILGAVFFSGGLSDAFILLAISSIFASISAVGAIVIIAYLLKNVRAVAPLITSIFAGSIVYLLAQVLIAYYGNTILYIPIMAISSVIFILSDRLMTLLIIQFKAQKIILIATLIFGGAMLYITPTLEQHASNLHYSIKYSNKNVEKNAREFLGFQPLISKNSVKVKTSTAVIRTGNKYDLNKLSNNTYVIVNSRGDGFSAYLYETLPFESLSKYVNIPGTCDLEYLTSVISNKHAYGDASDEKPLIGDIEPSSCVIYASTPKKRIIYGQSLAPGPGQKTFYYFVREGNVIIHIMFRAFGVENNGKAELIDLIDSLEPSDPDKLKFQR